VSRIAGILSGVAQVKRSILHIGSRDIIIRLRDQILEIHGYDVTSILDLKAASNTFQQRGPFDLVLIDVEGQGRVPQAEHLCEELRNRHPGQKIAFVCNYLVSIESDCPDEIIQAEFNPVAFVEGVRKAIE
jgi:CheY-like chemotaxis protein